jgi:hypothetical protein
MSDLRVLPCEPELGIAAIHDQWGRGLILGRWAGKEVHVVAVSAGQKYPLPIIAVWPVSHVISSPDWIVADP